MGRKCLLSTLDFFHRTCYDFCSNIAVLEEIMNDRLNVRIICAALVLVGLVWAVLDTVTLLRGEADPNRHFPYFMASVFLGGGVMLFLGFRKIERREERYALKKEGSYLSFKNHPRGRIDPPDGTTD